MPKKLYTANDIISLVKEKGVSSLVLAKGDIITPMARDSARELGLRVIEPGDSLPATAHPPQPPSAGSSSPEQSLESKVRKIVLSMLEKPQPAETSTPVAPVAHVDGRSLSMPPFPIEINRPEMDVRLEDVITSRNGSPIAA
ncbi:MAG: ethanolamine utilization protein, partial [Anaerolineaceae bacterium]|nr:ethanolamine utilization protein [Anaerolineaceae bacterium]